MNCSEDENVCSVKKENNSGYYRLHTIWRKDGFFINIASKNGAWRGEMTPMDVTKMSDQLKVEPESYLNMCREALTCHGGQPGMVYAVEEGYFAWKKVEDEDSGIKIKMGSVMLEPTNFIDTIQNLVTAALNCNKNLQEKLIDVSKSKEQILESKTELLNKLNELIKTKETMETDLYARFLLLINTKKKKIQELENTLEKVLKEKQNVKSDNLENPYEIDTDTDSEEEEEEKREEETKDSVIKRKFNIDPEESISSLPEEVPEEKKMKNDSESFASENADVECSSYSCQPSTSQLDSEKHIAQVNLNKVTSKDELYDYFYGKI